MALPFAWDTLLELVDDGKIVPIIGQDLLRIRHGDRDMLLYEFVAERLAAKLGVDPPAADVRNPLHDVASRYVQMPRTDWQEIYPAVKSLLPQISALPLPDALVKLAEIKPLKLFVSTTFDPLLKRAIDEIRHDRADVTKLLAFSPTGTQDVPDPLPMEGPATVFHLFGRVSATPDYAVTEDDDVEFMHSLQSTDKRPTNLFLELAQRNLLIVGNSLNSWLARFFVRNGKKERLWLACPYRGFVVDDRVRGDDELLRYLGQSPYVKVFSEQGGSIDFVNELHRRWRERQTEIQREAGFVQGDQPREIVSGCVFISYANEDREIAARIAKRLEDAKIDVWFDQSDLHSGDNFGVHIRTAIGRSGAFIPVISARALRSNQQRYFRLEWDGAVEKSKMLPLTMPYIHPVFVDQDVKYDDPDLPQKFREYSAVKVTQDWPTDDWVETIRKTQRAFRKGMV